MLFFTCINYSYAEDSTDFNIWLENFKTRALNEGISQQTIDNSLNKAKIIPRIIELDRKQPEFTLTLSKYLSNVVTKNRKKKGIRKIRENWDLLNKISSKYNVQPRFIVALWGIETDFGRVTGGFPVIDSLLTLSYDGRRSKYFSKKLNIVAKDTNN